MKTTHICKLVKYPVFALNGFDCEIESHEYGYLLTHCSGTVTAERYGFKSEESAFEHAKKQLK